LIQSRKVWNRIFGFEIGEKVTLPIRDRETKRIKKTKGIVLYEADSELVNRLARTLSISETMLNRPQYIVEAIVEKSLHIVDVDSLERRK